MSGIDDSDFTPTSDPSAENAPAEPVAFETSDLKDSSLETLGQYMLSATETNKYYPTDPLNRSTPDDPLVLGTNQLLDVVAGGSVGGFMNDVQAAAKAYYATISDGSTPDAVGGGTLGDLSDLLDKTGQSDGHDLLGQVVGDVWSGVYSTMENLGDPGQAVRTKVSDVLKHNRFSPGTESPYIQDGEYSDGMFSIQQTMGRYDEDAEGVAFRELAKVGFSLMLSAAGADNTDSNPDSTDASWAILQGIPSQLQLTRVDRANLEVSHAHGNPNRHHDGIPSTVLGELGATGIRRKGQKTEALDAKNKKSYGQLNSYLEPFGGPLPTGMIALAILAAVAVLVAGIVLAAIISLIFLIFPAGMTEETPEPLPMGAAAGQPDFGQFSLGKMLMTMLRMPILRSGKSFLSAMFFGILQFYFRIIDVLSSGYFIVVSRAAIRDLEQISDSIAEADFSNIIGGLEAVFVVLDAFATSTTFQFLNTLASLGDIVLLSGGLTGKGAMEFSIHGSAAGQPDVLPPAIANLHLKSRTLMGEDPDYRLAWRFGSTPSRYLLPPNILGSQAALGNNEAFGVAGRMPKGWGFDGAKTTKFGKLPPDAGVATVAEDDRQSMVLGGRYSADERQAFEDELNAYYIPFYFHDLRTNELLALHAFIDNFTDSFSPEWSNVGGFGRMDDVMVYKKTKRSMGLSFFMIATGPEDMDELYFGINKLVSMVYPQWSKGTQKRSADGKNTFIMPFSQIPTASPIIRMRVGELWSSNYSIHSLSRLFGLGTSSFTIDEKPPYADTLGINKQDDMSEKIQEILDELEKYVTKAQNGPPSFADALAGNTSVATGGIVVAGPEEGYTIGMSVIIKPSRYKVCKFDATEINFKENFFGKLKVPHSQESDRKGKIAGYVIAPIVDVGNVDQSETNPTRKKAKTKVRYAVTIDPASPIAGGLNEAAQECIICGDMDLILDHDQAAADAINAVIGTVEAGALPNPLHNDPEPSTFNAEKLNKFFGDGNDVTNNSIARAFHESGGQGIAGAITQLDFDWNIAPWDETPGRRAPTYVKVTMGFSPIHDIPLGLDSEGGLRAPAYNVGSIVRGLFGSGHSLAADAATKAKLTAALTKLVAPPPEPEPDPDTSTLQP